MPASPLFINFSRAAHPVRHRHRGKMNSLIQDIPGKVLQYFFPFAVVTLAIGLLATPYYWFAVLPGLLLFTVLAFWRFPVFAYMIIIFLIPFDSYRSLGNEMSQLLTISKLIGICLVIILIYNLVFRKIKALALKSNLWVMLLFFIITSLVAALFSDYLALTFDNLRKLFTAYVFFALTLAFITEKEFSRTLPGVLVAGVSFTSLLAVSGFLFNIPFFIVDINIKRGIGATNDPNIFSAMIIFTLPLLAYYFFTSSTYRRRLAVALLFCLNVCAVFFTYSRGGYLILLFVLVLLTFEYRKRIKIKYLGHLLLMIAVAIMIIAYSVPESYWQRQKSVTDTSDSSIGRRLSYLIVGWQAFKKDPLLGSGPGTFIEIYSRSDYAAQFALKTSDLKRYAHNSYLEVLIGTGLIGLAFFLAVIWIAFKNFHVARDKIRNAGDEEMALLVGAYRISFISVMVYLLILSIQFHKILWLALALSQIALNISQKPARVIADGNDLSDQ